MVFKLCLVIVLSVFFMSFSAIAENEEAAIAQQEAIQQKQEAPVAAVPEVEQVPAEVKQESGATKTIKDAEAELNNTKWYISLSQITQAEKKDKFTDTLRFKDGKVAMDGLVSQGFSASSYTLTIKDGKKIVWETMQVSEKKGIVFWKGEIEEGLMRGILSKHIDEKTVKDYRFYSTGKEALGEEALAVEAPPVAQEEPKKEEKDKKKR